MVSRDTHCAVTLQSILSHGASDNGTQCLRRVLQSIIPCEKLTPLTFHRRYRVHFPSSCCVRVRDGCSKTEPKFSPVGDPLPGGAGPPKFNQLEMVTTCTYRPSLVKIDACNFELSW